MRALGLLGLSVVTVGALGLATTASATVNDPPLWDSVQSAGGLILDDAVSAGVLGTGAPVVAGTFLGPAYFPTGPAPDDSITLPGAGFTSVFVATLDSAGTYFTWAQRAYGADASVTSTVVMGSATATTEDDTIMIMGTYTNGTLYFPTGVGDDSTALPHLGINPDAYIAALRPGGGFAWAQRLGPAPAIGDSFQPWASR